MQERILIVDDEKDICRSLAGILQDEGYETHTVGKGEDALEVTAVESFNLILLDIWLPGIDGLEVLKQVKQLKPEIEVIMISGHANIDNAVTATKLGAYDFIEKPLSLEKTLIAVSHALDKQRLELENLRLRKKVEKENEILGISKQVQALRQQIAMVAPTEGRVLICGENGTGKELIARAIHKQSPRSDRPFVEVNCAAIPEELIESELFGHEKGSFTGASSQRRGKFEQADNGTLFMDEIGDMSLKTQAKVLRVIEEQSFERVGGDKKITVNVRLIAASNKDLEQEIKTGAFREDLYYRLHVVPFYVPPLRERNQDIKLLATHFLQQFCSQNGKKNKKICQAVLQCLEDYAWPGNIRELKNLIERLVIMVPRETIQLADLPLNFRQSTPQEIPMSLKEARLQFEKQFIAEYLQKNKGNISQTARQLKIERSHLHRKLKTYGISEGSEPGG